MWTWLNIYLKNWKWKLKPVVDIPWQERENRLDKGEIDLCWICGLPYVWKAARKNPNIDLLAGPVFHGERYRICRSIFPTWLFDQIVSISKFEDLLGSNMGDQ